MQHRTIIIAEAGVNHNGNFQIAAALVEQAAKSGADYVKFQTYDADKLVMQDAAMAEYQKNNCNAEHGSQYAMLKQLQLPVEWHYKLKTIAEQNKIRFLSTGFDEGSIDFLYSLGVDFFKIPSGEITNKPLLQHIASKQKDVVLSTGMSDIEDIRRAVDVLELSGLHKNRITILHCNSEYPTQAKDVNLLAMQHIKQATGLKVGYSDHSLGIEVAIAAVALGACVIEKHFTLDRNFAGPDHQSSLEPHEMAEMIRAIRNVELAISGSGIKKATDSELKNLTVARKSLYFSRNLAKGSVLTKDDIVVKRPFLGISPMDIDLVIGRKLSREVVGNRLIKTEDFE